MASGQIMEVWTASATNGKARHRDDNDISKPERRQHQSYQGDGTSTSSYLRVFVGRYVYICVTDHIDKHPRMFFGNSVYLVFSTHHQQMRVCAKYSLALGDYDCITYVCVLSVFVLTFCVVCVFLFFYKKTFFHF